MVIDMTGTDDTTEEKVAGFSADERKDIGKAVLSFIPGLTEQMEKEFGEAPDNSAALKRIEENLLNLSRQLRMVFNEATDIKERLNGYETLIFGFLDRPKMKTVERIAGVKEQANKLRGR